MSEEQVGGLPGELEAWLNDRSSQTGRSREEVLSRAIATYRLLSQADQHVRENGEGALDPLDERLADLAQRLDALDAETQDKIEDVRSRVIQVMQTARSKADEGHTHEDLVSQVDDVEQSTASLSNSLSGLEKELSELRKRVDGGFENYESILESLDDHTEELDEKVEKLAHAVVDLRGRVGELEAAHARRQAVEELQSAANRKGVRSADCGSCGATVHIGLLSDPRCPHCASVFDGVEPGGRFLGSATLTIGKRPALEGTAFEPAEPEAVFDDE